VRSGGVREPLRAREPATSTRPSWSPDGASSPTHAKGRQSGQNGHLDWRTRHRPDHKPDSDSKENEAGFSRSPDGRRITLSCGPFSCGKPKGIWTLTLRRDGLQWPHTLNPKWTRLAQGSDFLVDWAPTN
jgi:hypothetical protein